MAADYKTVQGDTFDIVAFRQFGDEHLCGAVARANPEEMDALIFQAGLTLRLPEIKKAPKKAPLPPWYGEKS